MSLLVSLDVAVPLAVAVAGSLAIEAVADPGADHRLSRRPSDLAIRLGSYALIAAFWFAFSWRPWLACATTLVTVLVTVLVDALKRKVLGESLVFSDVALLGQVPRHPELYYTTPLTHPRMAGPILLGLGCVALWYWAEPSLLPGGALPAAGSASGLPLALLLAGLALRGPLGRRWLAARFPRPALEADVARYGVLATLIAYALRRDAEAGAAPAAGRRDEGPAERRAGGHGPELVVVVQLESFMDPERLGGPPLPLMARIRGRAGQYGRLSVPAHGAYTMRSEHAVLTGSEGESLGFGAFDPYLAFGGRDPTSLARAARAAGYRTVFVHPYHRDFFRRASVMRAMGFERLVTLEDFADAPRAGPYVSDGATAERILEEVGAGGRVLVFCATMENHGPWRPGRLPGLDDPLELWCRHAANTGRAVERLIDGLADRDALLCVYGDHVPSLPSHRPGGDARTDYALFRFGGGERPAPRRVDLSAPALGRHLADALATETPGPAGTREPAPRS